MLNLSEYLDGQKLYGDDFSLEQIKQWYEDEKEAYFNLISNNKDSYQYGYSLLNYEHGFRFLPDKRFPQVLSIGGAYGEELSPIKDRAGQITILESSDEFDSSACLKNHHVKYVQAQPNGKMPFPNNYFNLITCFGTLHHIPNVSTIVSEAYRVIIDSGHMLVREPIVSMGDWSKPRKGSTKSERGIPLHIFRKIITRAGFNIIREKKCMFSLTRYLSHLTKKPVYCSKSALIFDKIFCKLFGLNTAYHATNIFSKLRPTSVFYIIQK